MTESAIAFSSRTNHNPLMTKPNVLFILADQFRADCLGVAGNSLIRTPNLDALAASGTMFTNHFVQTCPCGPSRSCIFSGRYLCSTRSIRNYTPMVDAQENVGMWARAAGYEVGALGYHDYAIDPATLPAGDPGRSTLGYDNFYPGFEAILHHEHWSDGYFDSLRSKGYPEALCGPVICIEPNVPPNSPDDMLPHRHPAHYTHEDSEGYFLASRAADYIRDHDDGGWFLSVNFIKPHPPYVCAAPFHEMYDPDAMPAANRRPDELENPHPYARIVYQAQMLPDESDLRQTQATYYGMVSEVDSYIGLVIDELKASGQWGNTLVVFSSDHGEFLGDHYLIEKAHYFDEAMRVPLIVCDPQADQPGRRVEAFTESIDIAPTILEYLGAAIPNRVMGSSVLSAVRTGSADGAKREIYYEYDFRDAGGRVLDLPESECLLWVVRDDVYKYVQFAHESLPPLLFDLRADPGEYANLAGDAARASTVAEYAQRLLRWRMRNEDQRMEAWTSQYR